MRKGNLSLRKAVAAVIIVIAGLVSAAQAVDKTSGSDNSDQCSGCKIR